MKRSLATALTVFGAVAASQTATAQSALMPCNAFVQLKTEAEQRAMAVRASIEHKAERRDICAAVQRFYAAEHNVVKFLEDNKTWCGIPDQVMSAKVLAISTSSISTNWRGGWRRRRAGGELQIGTDADEHPSPLPQTLALAAEDADFAHAACDGARENPASLMP